MNPSTLPPASLDPTQLTGLAALAWAWTEAFAPRLLAAILILAIGLVLAHYVRRALDRVTARTRWIDGTIRPFLLNVVQYAIVILLVILVLNTIGIQTTSLLAVLGAAGLAVGLALQGTLSNIAAGIMLLWLRPFEIGDYIEVNGLAGTVEETGLFNCVLRSFDGVTIFAPNSTIWNFSLRNHTQAPGRLIALSITLTSGTSRDQATRALEAAFAEEKQILADPAPSVFVDSVTNGNLMLTCRIWAAHAAYSAVQRSVIDTLYSRLSGQGIEAASIQLVGRVVPPAADTTRLIDL